MFRSQSSDHHQGSITVLVQLLLIGVHASSYSGMWLYVVCAYDVPVRVVSGYVLSTCWVLIFNYVSQTFLTCGFLNVNCDSS